MDGVAFGVLAVEVPEAETAAEAEAEEELVRKDELVRRSRGGGRTPELDTGTDINKRKGRNRRPASEESID